MTLLLIDAHSLIHRCYHALPPLTNDKNEPVGALYGVAGILLQITQQKKADFCAALFDRPEPTFRKIKFSDYKIHRPKAEDALILQLQKARELFGAFSIRTFELAGYEGDDLIGTFARKFGGKGCTVRILTGDLDALQLVKDGHVEVETFKKGIRDTIIYNESEVVARYGLRPDQLIDYKALVGDASDNIPGVLGIGQKTASALLQKYGTLKAFFEKGMKEKAYEKIAAQKETAALSRELATIDCNVPVEATLEELACSFSPEKVLPFFEENGFSSLIKRLSSGTSILDTEHKQKNKQELFEEKTPVSEESVLALQLLGIDPHKNVSDDWIDKKLDEYDLRHVYRDIELPLMPVLSQMRENGIEVNVKRLKETQQALDKEIRKQETILAASLGDINLNSPKQLLEKLNTAFGLKLKSTSADALSKIQNPPSAIADLREYRELFKLKTTYLRPLCELVAEDGRIHPTFIQLGAATGRIACQNPNLQNIPQESRWSPEIRNAFVSKEGHSLVSCDYSQIELRVLAHLTQDPGMQDAFNNDKDIHTRTAAFIFGVRDEEVTKPMRRIAKTLNFGMVYGMGYRAFAQSAGVPGEEAKKFMQKYFEEFATIKKWQEHILQEARKKGFVRTETGRIRHLPELYASNKFISSEAERAAINMPVQGLAADILKTAMVRVHKELKSYGEKARMILTIHDELIFEIDDSLLDKGKESDIVKKIKSIMESSYDLSVPIIASAAIGKTWKELGE